MTTEVKKEFSVEEFQADFDNLFARVEAGETFIIYDGPSRFLIMPIDQLPQLEKRWRATD